MNWKLEVKEREDGWYEARLDELEGLFTIGIAGAKTGAIKEAKYKLSDNFPIFHETPEEIAEWERLRQEKLEHYRKTIG